MDFQLTMPAARPRRRLALERILEDGREVGVRMTQQQRFVLELALRGNWKPADNLELEFLRAFIRPHYADGSLVLRERLKPAAILHRYGPGAVDAAEWEYRTACRYCRKGVPFDDDGELCEDAFCGMCDGVGHESGWLITDLDGLLIEDDLP